MVYLNRKKRYVEYRFSVKILIFVYLILFAACLMYSRYLMTHHGVVDTGGPGVAKDQGIPGNLLLSPCPRPMRGQEGELWPIRGKLGAETDQSAARCHPTPSRHPQHNNHAAEKQIQHEQLRNMDNLWPIYSIKVNFIDWYDWSNINIEYFRMINHWSRHCRPNVPV